MCGELVTGEGLLLQFCSYASCTVPWLFLHYTDFTLLKVLWCHNVGAVHLLQAAI